MAQNIIVVPYRNMGMVACMRVCDVRLQNCCPTANKVKKANAPCPTAPTHFRQTGRLGITVIKHIFRIFCFCLSIAVLHFVTEAYHGSLYITEVQNNSLNVDLSKEAAAAYFKKKFCNYCLIVLLT